MKNRKLILPSLGAVTLVASAPLIAISCSKKVENTISVLVDFDKAIEYAKINAQDFNNANKVKTLKANGTEWNDANDSKFRDPITWLIKGLLEQVVGQIAVFSPAVKAIDDKLKVVIPSNNGKTFYEIIAGDIIKKIFKTTDITGRGDKTNSLGKIFKDLSGLDTRFKEMEPIGKQVNILKKNQKEKWAIVEQKDKILKDLKKVTPNEAAKIKAAEAEWNTAKTEFAKAETALTDKQGEYGKKAMPFMSDLSSIFKTVVALNPAKFLTAIINNFVGSFGFALKQDVKLTTKDIYNVIKDINFKTFSLSLKFGSLQKNIVKKEIKLEDTVLSIVEGVVKSGAGVDALFNTALGFLGIGDRLEKGIGKWDLASKLYPLKIFGDKVDPQPVVKTGKTPEEIKKAEAQAIKVAEEASRTALGTRITQVIFLKEGIIPLIIKVSTGINTMTDHKALSNKIEFNSSDKATINLIAGLAKMSADSIPLELIFTTINKLMNLYIKK